MQRGLTRLDDVGSNEELQRISKIDDHFTQTNSQMPPKKRPTSLRLRVAEAKRQKEAGTMVTAAASDDVVAQVHDNHTGLMLEILSFLNVPTLVRTKQVSKHWNGLCTNAIDAKCKTPKPFQTNKELKEAVTKYCHNGPTVLEQLACMYGYPIGKWNVSRVTDFEWIFRNHHYFNEDVSGWDLSNARTTYGMFEYATSIDQSLSDFQRPSLFQ